MKCDCGCTNIFGEEDDKEVRRMIERKTGERCSIKHSDVKSFYNKIRCQWCGQAKIHCKRKTTKQIIQSFIETGEGVNEEWLFAKFVRRALIEIARNQGDIRTVTVLHDLLFPEESSKTIKDEYQKMLQEENDRVDEE